MTFTMTMTTAILGFFFLHFLPSFFLDGRIGKLKWCCGKLKINDKLCIRFICRWKVWKGWNAMVWWDRCNNVINWVLHRPSGKNGAIYSALGATYSVLANEWRRNKTANKIIDFNGCYWLGLLASLSLGPRRDDWGLLLTQRIRRITAFGQKKRWEFCRRFLVIRNAHNVRTYVVLQCQN